MRESVSTAFLVLLETLTPTERAVFLLREVFVYDYATISDVVGRTETACRQLLRRARRRIDEGRPRFEADPARGAEMADRFLAAAATGTSPRWRRCSRRTWSWWPTAAATPRRSTHRCRVGPGWPGSSWACSDPRVAWVSSPTAWWSAGNRGTGRRRGRPHRQRLQP
ncbi:sigma factor-like helix-turn-helix DNA-binding protein [Oerskovia sp. M15]